jgi:hypothetical protein
MSVGDGGAGADRGFGGGAGWGSEGGEPGGERPDPSEVGRAPNPYDTTRQPPGQTPDPFSLDRLPPDPFPYGPPGPSQPFAPAVPARRRRPYLGRIIVASVLVIVFAAASVVTGRIADAEATRKPTQAELSAAAAAGLVQRWERISAGAMFPATIGYTTDQNTQEQATRVGIGPRTTCAAAVDRTLSALAAREGCYGAARATYVDALDGAVYTVGVLAFHSTHTATMFDQQMPPATFPAAGLNTLAFAGTAAARFDDAARQLSQSWPAGPYVVLIVAGYADGRAASATGEERSDVFSPATQIASAVYGTLDAPEVVNCQVKSEWSC